MVTHFLNKKVQMNESTDENEQAFVGACGTSGVQPLWEAEEMADGIDRMIGEGGKDSPAGTIFEGLKRYQYDSNSRKRPIDREIRRSISPHYRIGPFGVSGAVRKAEVQEKSLLRFLWYFSHQKLAYA